MDVIDFVQIPDDPRVDEFLEAMIEHVFARITGHNLRQISDLCEFVVSNITRQ